jgi:hypothetical protein
MASRQSSDTLTFDGLAFRLVDTVVTANLPVDRVMRFRTMRSNGTGITAIVELVIYFAWG